MSQASEPEPWRQRLRQRLRECVLTLRDDPADSQSQVQEIQILVAQLRAPSDSEFSMSRAQLSSEETTPNVNIPSYPPVQEPSADRDSGRRQLSLPQWPSTALQSTNRTQMRSINLETEPIRNLILEREEMRLNLPRERHPPMPPMFSLSVSRGPTPQLVPDSNMRRVSPPDSLPSLISDREDTAETEMRRWRSTATTLLAPNRQMCNVRALEVQIGDILKYGNKVNDGCVVTQCHPYELRHESDEDFFAPRVNLDATIKIQWKGKDGLLVSQNFGGLEMLEVLRVVDQDAEKDYYFGDVVCGSDRDERDEC